MATLFEMVRCHREKWLINNKISIKSQLNPKKREKRIGGAQFKGVNCETKAKRKKKYAPIQ